GARIVALDLLEQRGVVGIVVAGGDVRLGADGAVGVVDESSKADQRDAMPLVGGGARKADGGVVVLLGGDVVDDESEAHRAVAHAAGSWRAGGEGRWWYRASTPMVRHR